MGTIRQFMPNDVAFLQHPLAEFSIGYQHWRLLMAGFGPSLARWSVALVWRATNRQAMTAIDRFIDAAKSAPRSIVLPEGTDLRVLGAARHLVEQKIASVIVLGDPKETLKTAADAWISLAAIEIVDPSRHGETDHLAAGLADRNK